MPYELISDGKQVPLGDKRYLLSPQDLGGTGSAAGTDPVGRELR